MAIAKAFGRRLQIPWRPPDLPLAPASRDARQIGARRRRPIQAVKGRLGARQQGRDDLVLTQGFSRLRDQCEPPNQRFKVGLNPT